jgi:formylmethanofuran dehydrogenase subunit E
MDVRPITTVIQDVVETPRPPATAWHWKGDALALSARLSLIHETAFLFGETDMDIQHLLEKSTRDHSHLCPRQILGVRIGLAGMKALGFSEVPTKKQLLVISETDGCFVDGVIAATDCTVGHRTLRVEDYGKVAVTFVDTQTGRAVRVAPRLDIRERAGAFVPEEDRRYFAQMQAYQIMPDEEMFTLQDVILNTPIGEIISRPGVRVNCEACGEEITNEREIGYGSQKLCRACAGHGYYQVAEESARIAPLKVLAIN